MRTTTRPGRRLLTAALTALSAATLSMTAMAAPAVARPETPVPVCTGAKELLVDVTQDVENDYFLPARDGRMWASFDYTERVRIWSVGGRQHCVRTDYEGTWDSIAGPSPALTGTLSEGVTGTFTNTEFFMWTGNLVESAPTSGHLGSVDAGCTDVGVCADDSHLVVTNLYFGQGFQHCAAVRGTLEIDGGAHGHVTLTLVSPHKVTATGDITG